MMFQAERRLTDADPLYMNITKGYNRCRSFIHEHYQGLVQGSDTIARPQTKYHMKELTGVFQAMPGSYQKLNVLASSLGYFKLTEDYFKTLSLSYTPN